MNKNRVLERLFYVVVALFFVTIVLFLFHLGPFYTRDTINYLQKAQDVANGNFPHSGALSPGYPFFIGIISKWLLLNEANSLRLGVIVFILSSFFVLFHIVKNSGNNEKKTFFYVFLISFILVCHGTTIKILLTAHADSIFLVSLLIYFLFLFLWIKTFKIKWFLITTIVGSLCIWIKYNGLVLIPFLIIVSLIYGNKKFNYYILGFPIISALVSYFAFKSINGTVINHFQGVSFLEKIGIAFRNSELFFSNLGQLGGVYAGSMFTRSAEILMPNLLGIVFIAVLFIFFIRYFIINKNNKIEDVFLLFSFFYCISFFCLSQYAEYREINSRTMFPSILSFVLWLALIYESIQKPFKSLIIAILGLNLLYSFYFVAILNRSEIKNTFNHVSDFSNKKSVFELKKLQKKYNIQNGIYTNDPRNLFFALNYRKVQKYPSNTEFESGKITQLSLEKINKNRNKFRQDFSKNTSVILLFDFLKLSNVDSSLIGKDSKIYYIDNDVLILHIKK
jgi:hypothetical protein